MTSALLHPALIYLHLLGVVVWVGGMVFAHFVLRPAAVAVLQPPQRLPLMAEALGRFFRLVAGSIVLVLASGGALLAPVGMARAPVGWHLMLGLGLVMTLIFGVIWLRLYPQLRARVAAGAWPQAAQALGRIRPLVLVNLVLGLCAMAGGLAAR